MAMVASCSTLGSGITAPSAKNNTPSLPTGRSGSSMIMQPNTVRTSGSGFRSWSRGRNRPLEYSPAPPTSPSARPYWIIMAAK